MPKGSYSKISPDVSVHLAYLHQDLGLSCKDLLKRYPKIPKTTILRHAKKKIGAPRVDKRKKNTGRPRKLSDRDVRHLEGTLTKLRDEIGDIFSTDVERECGFAHASNRTIRRGLRRKGYKYSQCRKKGQLTKEDLTKRLKFAKKCQRFPDKIWTEGISFYLDGTGWVHKTNPSMNARTTRTRTWKRSGEALKRQNTAKGRKEGVGGKMAKYMVAIAYKKGVIGCHQYEGHIDGEKFSQMVKDYFPDLFSKSANPNRKLFLQDGDPSQNSRLAQNTWEGMKCSVFSIPPRSPDLNPIENIFHLIGKKLKKDAIDMNIEVESYDQYCQRVVKTVMAFDSAIIDRTIESMPKRLKLVIEGKGHRTKY